MKTLTSWDPSYPSNTFVLSASKPKRRDLVGVPVAECKSNAMLSADSRLVAEDEEPTVRTSTTTYQDLMGAPIQKHGGRVVCSGSRSEIRFS